MSTGGGDEAWAPAPPAASPEVPPDPAPLIPVPSGDVPVPSGAVPVTVTLAGYDAFVPLAHGGASVVYRAVQLALNRPVAVKVVHLRDPEAIRLFERELEITVRLGRQHPNIVTVLDTGTTGQGHPCLVMELADGGSLDDRLRARGPLPVEDVIAAGTVVADALSFAHAQGVIHRDVKPQNILVLPTSYVLADFGIARASDAGQTASLELFSYRHAAPQVLDGETPTPADDLYSLGSTMFTLLEGHAPYAGETPLEDSGLAYLRRARTQAAPELRRPDAPAGLREIVARCLARSPDDRYASASDLRQALLGLGISARSAPAPVAATREPEPVAATREPEPVAATPEPEPVAATPEPEPAAAPVFDTRIATSALAHLPVAAHHPDEPTGRVPVEPVPAPRPAPAKATMPWGWIAVVSLLLAGAVALGLTLARGHTSTVAAIPPVTPTPLATPTPRTPTTVASAPPAGTPSTATATGVPATASPTATALPRPKIVSLRATGSSLRVHWTDPSMGGYKLFVIVQLTGGAGTVIGQATAGQTQTNVTPDPTKNPCFAVVAYDGSSHSVASGQKCRP